MQNNKIDKLNIFPWCSMIFFHDSNEMPSQVTWFPGFWIVVFLYKHSVLLPHLHVHLDPQLRDQCIYSSGWREPLPATGREIWQMHCFSISVSRHDNHCLDISALPLIYPSDLDPDLHEHLHSHTRHPVPFKNWVSLKVSDVKLTFFHLHLFKNALH